MDNYDLELDNVVKKIKNKKAKRVLIQLPDGLKPKATEIVDELEGKCNGVEFLIWFGSCFGGCDVPLEVERIKVDLIVQFGHSKWL